MTEEQKGPFCPECVRFIAAHPWDGQSHTGTSMASHIQCAFDRDGNFTHSNWACRSILPIRDEAEEREVWNDDQHAAVIRGPEAGTFFLVSYYKHRGRTEGLFVLDSSDVRRAILSDVEQWLANRVAEVLTK